jgi:16S rRNA processing protein RimM
MTTPRLPDVRFLVVGRILGAAGLSGEVRAQILTDFPNRFQHLSAIHLGDNLRPYRVESVKLDGATVILKLAGVDDPATAQALRNADLQVPIEEAVTLEPDQYYWHQIEGLEVWTDQGVVLGRVNEVLRTGSNDVYVVRTGARELLLPAIDEVIREVDLPNRRLVVHLIPGLVDE